MSSIAFVHWDYLQVNPVAGPQELSADTAVGVETTALDVRLTEADDESVDAHAGGVKTDEVATRPAGLRYQLASGSPKHSPMVTPL